MSHASYLPVYNFLLLNLSTLNASQCFTIRNMSKPPGVLILEPSGILKYARSLNEAAMLGVGCRWVCHLSCMAIFSNDSNATGATRSRPFGTDGRRWRPNTESQAQNRPKETKALEPTVKLHCSETCINHTS